MLINAKAMLNKAKNHKYAVGQFNINNLEWTKAILEVAEATKSPVILGVSEGAAKYMGGYDAVVGMVRGLDKALNITVPVALHLDHGSSVESAKAAIDAGFTSVMYDGSEHSIDENIENTKQVVEYAKKFDVSVEAEVGTVGGEEDGVLVFYLSCIVLLYMYCDALCFLLYCFVWCWVDVNWFELFSAF